ncbi:MAG TPA: glutamate 5-kinase, partial [Myxococcales bacterium]|nr:glutamate 5-kinase [Myxococcales bacterium]
GSLRIDRNTIFELAAQVNQAVRNGLDVAVVSSGAVALGMEELEINERPQQMAQVQALAAAGQGMLMQLWREAFDRHSLRVGQVLLTHSDLADRQRFLNVRATLDSLLAFSVIPIINENDTVMTDEITVGDNDNLAAQVTKLVGGDLLILLSNVDGLLDSQDQVVSFVGLDDQPENLVDRSTSTHGRGGMASKIEAARTVGQGGISVVVANGKRPNVVTDILAGRSVGTRFDHKKQGLPSRKHWIAYTLKPKGEIHVDAGAANAVQNEGASLLSIGIVRVEGKFSAGDLVRIIDPKGQEFGRGLSRHSSDQIPETVGQRGSTTVHRDDLIVN